MLLPCLLAISVVQAQGWAALLDNTLQAQVYDIATDSQDNVYTVGYFNGPKIVLYDATGQQVNINNIYGSYDAFMVKFASNGTYIWFTLLSGQNDDRIPGIILDSMDNVVVAAYALSGYLYIYNATGQLAVTIYNSYSNYLACVVKFTASGQYLWNACLQGSADDFANAVAVDQNDNIVLVGSYASNPLVIQDSLGYNAQQLNNSGAFGAFVIKYTSNGSLLWASRQDGSLGESASSVSTDGAGNVFVCGYYVSNPLKIFNSLGRNVASVSNSGGQDSYLVKYLSNGSFSWITRQDGTGVDNAMAVQVDLLESVYVGGNFQSNILTIRDGSGQIVSSLNTTLASAFLIKYSNNGSYVWSLRLDGYAQAINTDHQGNVIFGGFFSATPLQIYDGRGLLQAQLAKTSFAFAGYTIKYTSNGSYLWAAYQHSKSGKSQAMSVAIDSFGNVCTTGWYYTAPLIMYDSSGNAAYQFGFTSVQSSIYVVQYGSNGDLKPQYPKLTSSTMNLASSSVTLQSVVVSSSTGQLAMSLTVSGTLPGLSSISLIPSQESPPTITSTPLVLPTFDVSVLGKHSSSPISSSSDQFDIIQQQVAGFNLVYIIMVGALFIILQCACLVACFIRLRKRMPAKGAIFSKAPTATFEAQSVYSNYSTDSTSTAYVTSHVLAVPQFLHLQFGLHFRLGNQIARGGGGSVHFCQVLDPSKISGYDGQVLVVKNLSKNVGLLSEVVRVSFYQEVAMLYLFRDQPQFAKLFGFSEEPATIVLKFYEHGSLKQYVLAENPKSVLYSYSKKQILHLTVQLSQGLAYLHSRQFVHNDVKPDNVLLEATNGVLEPRITDFGISRLLDASTSQVKDFKLSVIKGASIAYAAPEVVLRFRMGFVESSATVWKSGDVYALSVVLIEVLNRNKVWSGR